jgi:UDP-glucuronate 4-epimerase
MLPIQPGDMHSTSADTTALRDWVGFKPDTPVTVGVQRFVDWYRSFYRP